MLGIIVNGRHYIFNCVNISSSITLPRERVARPAYIACRSPCPFHFYIIHNHTKQCTVSNSAFNAFRNDAAAVKYEVAVRPKPVM